MQIRVWNYGQSIVIEDDKKNEILSWFFQNEKQSTLFVLIETKNKPVWKTYNINYNYHNDTFYINDISAEGEEERYVFVAKDENVLNYFMIDTDEIMDYKESVFDEAVAKALHETTTKDDTKAVIISDKVKDDTTIEFKNGSCIKILTPKEESARGNRAQLYPRPSEDFMPDWCVDKEMLDEILTPFCYA